MRISIIGCGSIGERHLRNLKLLGVKDIIICDTDKNRVRNLRVKYGLKFFFSDLRQAFKEKIDAALICTPPFSHVSIALKIIDCGAHVFIEKPISHSLAGLDMLIKKARRKKILVSVGYNLRFHKALRLVKKLLSEGRIGKVLSARSEFGQNLAYWRPWQDYRRSYTAQKSSGGGIILDGSHEIDYLRWLLGEPKEVSCLSGRVSKLKVDTEDTAEILMRFKSGALAGIHLDFIRQDYARNCELIGEKGTIIWDYASNSVKVYSAVLKKWRPYKTEDDPNEMYISEMRHFLNCLSRKEEPLVDAKDGYETLRIALLAKKSAKLGKTVSL